MISSLLQRIPVRARWEFLLILSIMLLSVVLFRSLPLDYQVIHFFYHPDEADPWPLGSSPLFQFLYDYAPLGVVALCVAGVSLIVFGSIRKNSPWHRWLGIFLLSSVLLGPGLMVNVVFKDHWGRPRPRQTSDFNLESTVPYHPLLQKGTDPTHRSFPCGHCSVGFVLLALWFWWRRRRPALGVACLLTALIVGGALALARMSAGGHYPSDVLWSLLFCWLACWILYYPALALFRIPDQPESQSNLPH